MATKIRCLSSQGKNQYLSGGFSTINQYTNLNLNKISKYSDSVGLQSKSVLNDDMNKQGN
jgi:hypothetical protein